MICTMLDCVRPVSVDIWRVERCVCVWSSWLSRPISSFTVGHVLFSTRVLRSAALVPLVKVKVKVRLYYSAL